MKVLLVDDHRLFRAGLAALLKAWGWEVVGEADNGAAGIAAVRELEPEVVFMDINMPGTNGLEATRGIKAEMPDTKVVILTVSDQEEDLFEAIKSGAEGYLLKNLNEDEFAELVARIGRGEPVISPTLAKRLLDEFARLSPEPDIRESETGLSEREHDVLRELITGASNKEIAEKLYVSDNTIGYHMKNILGKLHMRNRAQVIAWAIERGYGRSNAPTDR